MSGDDGNADLARSGAEKQRPELPHPSEADVKQDHEGATEEEVGDRTGPGAGYDDEPEKADDGGGVA